MEQLRNGFWFAHERLDSSARVHYGDISALPAELGRFDSAVLGSVLLHTRDPLRLIGGCAALADELVITERYWADLEGGPLCRLCPTPESPQWHTWWEFSPGFFVQFLEVLGFETPTVTRHDQVHVHAEGRMNIPMFTVTATRAG
jgi:O-methyltransferase